MYKIIYYELKKVFQKRTLFLFISICFIINGLQIIYEMKTPNDDGYNMIELSEMYKQYGECEITSSYLRSVIEQKTQMAGDDFFSQEYKEIRMLDHIQQKSLKLEGYDSFLADIPVQTQKMLKARLFSQNGMYYYRNLQNTERAYSNLEHIVVDADFDEGILLFTGSKLTDVFCLMIAVAVIIRVFVTDYELRTGTLIKCMKLGHAELFFSKILTACIITFVIYGLFYGTNYLLIVNTVGFGNINRSIQSVDGYFASTFLLSVGQYLWAFFLSKVIGAFTICISFIAVCVIVRNSVVSIGVGIVIYGIEYFAYRNIQSYSWLSLFKQFNIYALNNVKYYFMDYENINFFSFPVSIFQCGVISVLLFTSIGIVLAFVCYTKNVGILIYHKEIQNIIHKKTLLLIERMRGHFQYIRNQFRLKRKLIFYEIFKILFMNKGILILLFLIVFQMANYINTYYFIDSNEFYYRSYSDKLYGELTAEKNIYLKEEKQRFAALETERNKYFEEYDNGIIDEIKLEYYLQRLEINSAQTDSFNRAYEQYLNLCGLKEKGHNVQYIYITPWKLLFGSENSKSNLMLYGIAFVVLILLLSPSGSIENSTGMEKIIQTSVVGKKGIWQRKIAVSIMLSVMVSAITFLPNMIKVISVYGLSGLNASVYSYISNSILPEPLTMRGYFIIRIGIRLVAVALAAVGMFFISEKSKNRIVAVLVGILMFLVPVLVLMVKI